MTISEHDLPTNREGNGKLRILNTIESQYSLVSGFILNAAGASSLVKTMKPPVEYF
jgi:hypothetical protein